MSRTVVEAARTGLEAEEVRRTISEYRGLHNEAVGGNVRARKTNYAAMVNQYYDLATNFYEYGWGQSFHFAPRFEGETVRESILRHEHHLAHQLGLRKGMTVLDVGCGVGGPARNIARFSGASITGLNNNAYQIGRGREIIKEAGLEARCDFVEADFMDMPIDDQTFDAAYAIEATCHAPSRTGVFAEVRRTLKPGACFAGYEWCLTDRFDASNAKHQAIKNRIEEGNALPDLTHFRDVLNALEAAGFQEVEGCDLAPECDLETPWYLALSGEEVNWAGFARTRPGRFLSHHTVRLLERVHVAPHGATELSDLLNIAADALVAGGEEGIFTPLFFFHARKTAVQQVSPIDPRS